MSVRQNLFGDESERAVSPVIGVILMVAITVILAAVIAAFVLDLGQSQGGNVDAGVQFNEHNSTHVTAQLVDSGNADHVNITGVDFSGSAPVSCNGEISGTGCWLENTGDTAVFHQTNDTTAIGVSGSDENVIANYP